MDGVGGVNAPRGPRAPGAPQAGASDPWQDVLAGGRLDGGPGGFQREFEQAAEGKRMAESRYPDYDVMVHAEAWDPHTRSIVQRRLDPPKRPAFLTQAEAQALRAVVCHLLYEDRDDIIGYVLSHIDDKLLSPVGEAQRKEGLPPQAELVRDGLASIDQIARERYGKAFADATVEEQFAILAELQHGAKELFQKLLGLSVEALASHPTIWSEIGYGGPAYPRGYYRIEAGVTDPWEARTPSS